MFGRKLKVPLAKARCPARGPNGEVCGYLALHAEASSSKLREHDWQTVEESEVRHAASQLIECSYTLNRIVGRCAASGVSVESLQLWSDLRAERIQELAELTRDGAFG